MQIQPGLVKTYNDKKELFQSQHTICPNNSEDSKFVAKEKENKLNSHANTT